MRQDKIYVCYVVNYQDKTSTLSDLTKTLASASSFLTMTLEVHRGKTSVSDVR